jgi:carbonic anhydrase
MLYLASTILLLQAALGESAGWVYANKGKTVANAADQAATWGVAAKLCTAGKEQSPVNVVTNHVVLTIPAVITTHFDTTVSYAMTTAHGFQLFETSPIEHKYDAQVKSTDVSKRFKKQYDTTASAKGYSMIGGSKYNFYQVHWHTPSENTIDGLNAAMEAHFVHQLANDPNANAGNPFGPVGYHRLAVIGLQYQLGLTCNAELAHFWDFFPESVGIKEYTGSNINFNLLLADELAKGYYHWVGSLTTPPCTEGVSWNLLTAKEKTCQAQVNTLKSKYKYDF